MRLYHAIRWVCSHMASCNRLRRRLVFHDSARNMPVTFGMRHMEIRLDYQIRDIWLPKSDWHQKTIDHRYWQFHRKNDVIAVVGACPKLGECTAILGWLHFRVLEQLHNSYPGIMHMKTLVKSYAYWRTHIRTPEALLRVLTFWNEVYQEGPY